MAIGTIALGTLAVAALGGAGHTAGEAGFSAGSRRQLNKDYNSYKQFLDNYNLNGLTTEDMLGTLYMTDKLNLKEYEDALKSLETFEERLSSGNKMTAWEDIVSNLSKKDAKQLSGIYSLIMQEYPEVANATYKGLAATSEGFREQLYKDIPTVTGVEPPKYYDTNIETDLLDIEPVHLWSGQELADLHNINYDPNHYYDLIKAGTEANKKHSDFTSRQLAHAALVGNESGRLSYLDSIRNSKADAIAKGATMGQRAAAEVLATKDAMTNFANTQADVVGDRAKLVESTLLADAEAKLTARNYFDNLAKSLATDSSTLYAADSELYGQKHQTNAEIFGADSALRGMLANANANMYAAYVQNKAAIGAANRANRAAADDYAWVFENALRANNDNPLLAYNDVDKYLFNRYTGMKDPYDYILDKELNQ